jgi:broad specificity phosphatase PhoE
MAGTLRIQRSRAAHVKAAAEKLRRAGSGYPFIAPGDHVPQGFADLGQRTRVMISLHQFPITMLFGWANGPDKDLPQVQRSYSRMNYNSDPYIHHWETGV